MSATEPEGTSPENESGIGKAKDMAGDVAGKAKDVAGTVGGKAKDVAGVAGEKAGGLLTKIKEMFAKK